MFMALSTIAEFNIIKESFAKQNALTPAVEAWIDSRTSYFLTAIDLVTEQTFKQIFQELQALERGLTVFT